METNKWYNHCPTCGKDVERYDTMYWGDAKCDKCLEKEVPFHLEKEDSRGYLKVLSLGPKGGVRWIDHFAMGLEFPDTDEGKEQAQVYLDRFPKARLVK